MNRRKNQVADYQFQQNDEKKMLSTNEWRTPDWLFNSVRDEFDLVVDRAADRDNHKLPFYYTKNDRVNVLDLKWTVNGWANIPYSEPAIWFAKAHKEAKERGVLTVLLVRVDPANNYWIEHTIDAHVRYLAGRIKFWDANNQPRYGATFSSALIIFASYTIGNHNSSYWDYRSGKGVKLF